MLLVTPQRRMENEKDPMPLGVAILNIGILLANIFSIGVQFRNKEVTREECSKIETQFVWCESFSHLKRPAKIKEIAIDCANGKRYFINGIYINSELLKSIDELAYGENITMFIHPNRNAIVELSTSLFFAPLTHRFATLSQKQHAAACCFNFYITHLSAGQIFHFAKQISHCNNIQWRYL